MLLNNITLVNQHTPVGIVINEEKITAVRKVKENISPGNISIHFEKAIAFPGLINSHDHLDFNCFRPLGNKIYNNYTEWGNYIHTNYKEEINAVLKIPQPLRIAWGIYKNLLAGVTTVINHGDLLNIESRLLHIYQQAQNLHSVKFQKNWKWKLNNPRFKNKVCAIHTGEGTDKQSANEIDKLLRWNLFKRKLVGVHGVAMNNKQAKKFEAVVWCPESNKMLLNKHADIKSLKTNTRIVFGTDSVLTGNWNIWQHLRLARSLQLVSDEELFGMVTCSAAQLWHLNNGTIQAGKEADIVIAKTKNGEATWNDLFAVDPQDILLVLQKGKIRMFDETLLDQLKWPWFNLAKYSEINLNGTVKFVEGNISVLINAIKNYYPAAELPAEINETVKMFSDD